MKGNIEELSFYERFWKREIDGKNIFHGLPDWRTNLKKRLLFYKKILKGQVLDVGCGTGIFSLAAAKIDSVQQVYGIDLSETAIKECLKKTKSEKMEKKLVFETGSVSNLPFKKNSFDSIFAFEMIEHIVDTEKMFQEFNRVLKQGGYLGVTTVDFNLLKRVIIALFYFETYFEPTTPHIRFFTKNTLKRILEENGFKLIQYQWDGTYFGIMPKGQAIIAQKYKDI